MSFVYKVPDSDLAFTIKPSELRYFEANFAEGFRAKSLDFYAVGYGPSYAEVCFQNDPVCELIAKVLFESWSVFTVSQLDVVLSGYRLLVEHRKGFNGLIGVYDYLAKHLAEQKEITFELGLNEFVI